MKLRRLLLTLLLAALSLSAACSKDDPVEPPPPSEVSFAPPSGSLDVTVFVPLHFKAVDAQGEPVEATFRVEGEVVEITAEFVWAAQALGDHHVSAEAEQGGESFQAQWVITASEEGANEVPPVTVVLARAGLVPGSIEVVWDRALASEATIPLADYLVYYSEQPIPDPIPEGTSFVVTVHDGSVIKQRAQIENLPERVMHSVRVVTRDQLQRLAQRSTQVQSESTGHYEVYGTVTVVRPAPHPVEPLEGVLADLGGYKAITDDSGFFAIRNVPDLLTTRLFLEEGSGAGYYTVLTPPIVPDPATGRLEFEWNLPLFPRGDVAIVENQEPGEYDDFITQLEFLLVMSSNERVPQEFWHWEEYPIPVYAPDYAYQPADGPEVRYMDGFVRAVQAWNEVIGEELLVLVDQPVSYGCNASMNLVGGSGLLGRVSKVVPYNDGLYEGIPQLLSLELLESFNTQELCNRIIAHEMGHVLIMDHSPSVEHLMHFSYPRSTGGLPTPAEGYAARLIRHMPLDFPATGELGGYDEPEQFRRTPPEGASSGDGVLCELPETQNR